MKAFPIWILAGLLVSSAALAQSDQAQLLRPSGAADLNSHLARLASNPRDVAALIGAGEAALALDDPRAAAGFFARADAIDSGNGRIKAGLGRVNLQMQNPGEALRLFDKAGRLGYPDTTILSDRGLARDMTGDQAGAQRDYQAALKVTPDNAELIRRYAASLGISGQVEASERALQPLLYKSDRAAWRYRAFILAMNNRQADAKKIADQTMPGQFATAIIPYMQKMPFLTAAQKAAAVHFGHFPTRISTTIVAITPTPAAPGAAAPSAPVQVAQVAPPVSARNDRLSRREQQRRVRLAQADTARSTQRSAQTLAPATARVQPQPQPQLQLQPQRQPDRTSLTNTAPANTTLANTARTVAVPPQPAPSMAQPIQRPPLPSTAPQPVPSQPMVPVVREAAAPVRAPLGAAVQGPPAPGFGSVETAAARPIAPPSSQPSAASQINAITLAQASPPANAAPPAATPQPQAPAPTTVAPPTVPAAEPVAAVPQPNPEATRSLADIIRAIDVPEAERQPSAAAVDLAELAALQAKRRADKLAIADKVKKAAAAKVKAEADAKAKKEAEAKALLAANPARSWLQIATGANREALAFTLKAMRKKYDDIAPQSAWVATWGRTNRLVIGPFASFTRAKTLESKLKGAGADVFAWQSDAGEVVERLGGQ